MRIYKFYDTDIMGHEEYDISGRQYHLLLHECFRHCSLVSVILSPNFTGEIQEWELYRISTFPEALHAYSHYGTPEERNGNRINGYEVRCYKLTEQMQKIILERADSLFQWLEGWGFHNPDDITFYRPDCSIFFSSLIHEGECTLFLNDNEDVSGVTSGLHWVLINSEENTP